MIENKVQKSLFFVVFFVHSLVGKSSSLMVEHSIETEKKSTEFDDYFKACLHQAKGQIPQAKHFYKKLFQNKRSKGSMKSYIRLLFDSQDFAEVIKQTEKKYHSDFEMQLLRAQAFLMTGNNESADSVFVKLSKQKPADFTVHYQRTICLLRMNKIDEASKVITTFLKSNDETPQHAMFYFLQSKIFLLQNNQEKALASIDNSLRLYPKFDEGILFKSLLLEQMGKPEDAIAGYLHFLEQTAHPRIEQELMNMLLKYKKDVALADRISSTLLLNNAEYFYTMGSQLAVQGRYLPALAAFGKTCALDPTRENAWKAQLNILKQKNDPDRFLDIMIQWMTQTEHQAEQISLLISLSKSFLPRQKIMRGLEALHQKRAPTKESLSFLGDLYFEEKSFQQCLKTLDALEVLTKNEQLASEFLFQKGYVYFMLEEKAKAEEYIKQSLAINASPEASNLLAIMYAEKEGMLEAADGLISQALTKQPHNHAFLDTKQQILKKKMSK